MFLRGMTRIWSYTLLALICLVAEGALVVGLAFGVGTWLHHEFGGHVPPVPGCIPGIDHGYGC
jgi:hypothetical protein